MKCTASGEQRSMCSYLDIVAPRSSKGPSFVRSGEDVKQKKRKSAQRPKDEKGTTWRGRKPTKPKTCLVWSVRAVCVPSSSSRSQWTSKNLDRSKVTLCHAKNFGLRGPLWSPNGVLESCLFRLQNSAGLSKLTLA